MAGSIGPIGKPLAPLGNISFEDAVAAYREQAEGLSEGGVDLFLIETLPSLDQARAALEAVRGLALGRAPSWSASPSMKKGRPSTATRPEAVVRDARGAGRRP